MENTQADQSRKLQAEFDALGPIEQQRFYCERRQWNPLLKEKARRIIVALAGKRFDVTKLEEKHGIYSGYFFQPSIKAHYKREMIAGKPTDNYSLKSSDRRINQALLKECSKLRARNLELQDLNELMSTNLDDMNVTLQEYRDKEIAREEKKDPRK